MWLATPIAKSSSLSIGLPSICCMGAGLIVASWAKSSQLTTTVIGGGARPWQGHGQAHSVAGKETSRQRFPRINLLVVAI